MKNIHLGCGDIYLEDYINCDICGKFAHEVTKDDLDKNKTTLDKYFKYHFGTPRRDIIFDKKMNFVEFPWDFESNSIDKIVMISCFEHFSEQEALGIVKEMKRVIKVGGQIITDVPDIKKTIDLYYDSDPKWAMTLIYCNGKNPYSFHKFGYTDATFRGLWGDHYLITNEVVVSHVYPMLNFVITKVREE
jgi:SAM-dependent methyltransferase